MKSSWSRKYYTGLKEWQHDANDKWFAQALSLLNGKGKLFVPNLKKSFDKKGAEL